MLGQICAAARQHALHHPFGHAAIQLGELGPDAVALGAATLPVERFLNGAIPATPGAPPVRGDGREGPAHAAGAGRLRS